MIAAAEPLWPEGLVHALISSDLTTPQINHILATGVIPADLKENT